MTMTEVFSLLGGVGLFLYGMTLMSAGLRNACGNKLQKILEGATKNKIRAVLVGIAVTVLVQSSSATDVMVIGFVNSGLMVLSQAIGVIMGANIGTTVTAQITAFNISAYAPLMIFMGAVMYLFVKKQMVKYIGYIIMGFGMLFQGISFMKAAIVPLSETEGFVNLLQSMSNPLLTVLFGVLFTAILQSSSSATVIFQAFAVQGLISYSTCVFLVIGSAVGSVTPNLLASLTTNRDGKRTALLNLIFNLIRATLMFTLVSVFPQVLTLIQSMSPDNVARQVANTHTIFAIISVLIILPFSELIVRLTRRLLPETADEQVTMEEKKLLYISNTGSIPPAVALHQAKNEVARMGHIALHNLQVALECLFETDADKAQNVEERESVVNFLNNGIVSNLVELRASDLSQKDLSTLYNLILSVDDIERISNYSVSIARQVVTMIKEKAAMSDEAVQELKEMAERSIDCVTLCLKVFEEEDYESLPEAEALENMVDEDQERLINSHIRRMMHSECNPFMGLIFSGVVTDLERCTDHAINLAFSLNNEDNNSRMPMF